jgi:hypothetical protein
MNNSNFVPAGSFIDLSEYSSNLKTLTWNGDGSIDVTFKKSKAVYRYYHCPPSLWEFLLKGKETQDKHDKFSIGAAFHQEVIQKSDIYPYERIE